MNTYNINWKGLDRGHESAWGPDIWLGVLRLFGKYSPVDLSDAKSTFYSELIEKFPDTQWLSDDGSGQFRNFFRDGREPWSSTGVVDFNSKTQIAEITDVGKKVNDGYVSYADVLAVTALSYEESGEKPFRIILEVLRSTLDKGLHFEDIARVMRHYRQGDSLLEVLALPNEVLTSNNKRRLRAILLIMMYSGLVVQFKDRYYSGQDPEIRDLKLTTTEKTFPPNVDRLSIALKLFAEKRKDDGPDGWFDGGRNVNGKIREYFDVLTVDTLMGFDEAKITELFCGLKGSDGKTFEPMWSGKPGQGWGNIKPNDPEAVQKIVDFLVLLKSDASVSARFLDKDFVRPAGFGRSVISELLMKFHSDTCLKHGERSHVALAWLGLIDFDWRNDYSDAEYKQVCGAAAKILGKMVDMKLPRQIAADGTEDTSKPDYLTVNEFIYFVNTNQDLIKEKVMSKQWKSVNSKDKVKNGTRKLSDALSGNDMLKRLVAALRTKPFAILAGHSGTGKSQLVRRLAYMTCNNELLIKEGEGKTAPGNYCMVQVKPNWHDSTDLLGYYSEMGERHFVNTPFVEFICKAYAYPETPFFVCLDEMNLAPVEQYFAEYLSAIESMENKGGVWLTDPLVEVDKTGEKDASGKEKVDVEIVDQIMKGAASKEAADWIQAHGLTIPKNLFVVGTVNMDETTCQFSRKVLDRAMTLLMNDVKFSDMGASKKPSDEELLDEAGLDFFLEGEERGTVGAAESALLDGINEPLANTPFVVAYRFANEYALYEAALAKLDGVDLAAANEEEKKKYAMEALDHVVMMKLLPRIHGERSTVRVLFEGGKRGDKNVPGLESKLPSGELSVDMMKKILERRDEYLTFWP